MDARHHGAMPEPLSWVWLCLVEVLAVFYVLAVIRIRKKRRPWPWVRTICWFGGLAAITAAMAGPIADRTPIDFRMHMLAHLLLGMLAPLLLVVAMPITVALRAVPPSIGRAIVRDLRARPLRFLAHPITAAMLDMGGLWALYTTGLSAAMHRHAWLDLGIHLHILIAGYLFTAAMISRDPISHRPSRLCRVVTLVLALAAHAILAKYLYRHPPAGVPREQAQSASLLMYYGGDAVDAALIILFCRQWFVAGQRRTEPLDDRSASLAPSVLSR